LIATLGSHDRVIAAERAVGVEELGVEPAGRNVDIVTDAEDLAHIRPPAQRIALQIPLVGDLADRLQDGVYPVADRDASGRALRRGAGLVEGCVAVIIARHGCTFWEMPHETKRKRRFDSR